MNGTSASSAYGGHGTLPNLSLQPNQTPNQEGFHPSQWIDNRASVGTPKGVPPNPADISARNHQVLGPKSIRSHMENPYPNSSPHPYPEPSAPRIGSYHHPSSNSTVYPDPTDNQTTYGAQTSYTPVGGEPHHIPRTTATNFLYSTAAPGESPSGSPDQPTPAMYLSSPGSGAASGPSSWHYWTNNLASTIEPEEYMSSANALMQLGGHSDQSASSNASTSVPIVSQTIMGNSTATDIVTAQQRWPLVIFSNEQDATGHLSPHAS
jgi:hypothetical protein